MTAHCKSDQSTNARSGSKAWQATTCLAYEPTEGEPAPAVVSAARLAVLEKRGGASSAASDPEEGEREKVGPPPCLSLDRETRAAVDTATAAYHLNRQPQTLRGWACREDGPLRPIRMHGRLMWPTAKLRELCGVQA